MTRIPTHTVADAPVEAQEFAAKFEKRMGKLMNIHAGMADSPADRLLGGGHALRGHADARFTSRHRGI